MLEPILTERLPPAIAAHLAYVIRTFGDDPATEPSPTFLVELESAYDEGEDEYSRAPELAELGLRLVRRENHPTLRKWGCIWLTLFPSLETVRAMRAIIEDPVEPLALRDQAVWTLGFRQLGTRHDTLFWAPEVVRAADEGLVAAARLDEKRELEQLCLACRHSDDEALFDVFASDPLRWAEAIEAFGNAPLARRLLAALPDIPAEHAPRVVRLVAHVLGEEAAAPLLSYAQEASGAEQIEALYAVQALDSRLAKRSMDAFLDELKFDAPYRARAAWHAEHPGVIPTVRALAVARRTGAIDPAERSAACGKACDDFFALGRLLPFSERYLYGMWCSVALRARDPKRVADLVGAHRAALERPELVEPYLDALANEGRFRQLATVAQELDATGHAAWLLATRGRPFLALAARRIARTSEPRVIAAQAIALFLAGRPDLAQRTLTIEQPTSASLRGSTDNSGYPGPDERWRLAHEPDAHPWLGAIAAGVPLMLSHAIGAPEDADADVFDLSILETFERSLRARVEGSSVYLVGDFDDRKKIEEDLVRKGARLVSGPFGGTDYFVLGRSASLETVARLERLGARRLDRAAIEEAR